MLELRPICERCDRELPADRAGAMICSFECTFCSECAAGVFSLTCPNCGGELKERPTRSAELLQKFAAATERISKNHP